MYGKIYNNCWNILIYDNAEFLGPYTKRITNNTCVALQIHFTNYVEILTRLLSTPELITYIANAIKQTGLCILS